MNRIALSAGRALAALAFCIDSADASTVIRPPTVSTLQRPSFWGVNTNLQHHRDRLQRAWANSSGRASNSGALSSTSPPQ
jgi:hypothetical protein